MPVPSSINDLSTTAASNYPAGSETPAEGDNHHRQTYSFIATLRDWFNGTSPANITVANLTVNGNIALGDAAGDTMSVAPSAVSWTNNPTHSGNHTFSGTTTLTAGSGSYTSIVANAAARTFSTVVTDFSTLFLNGNYSNTTSNGIGFGSGSGGGAGISFSRGGTWDTSISFYTNPSSNAVTYGASERMRIGPLGNVTVYAPTSGYGLNIPTGTPASAAATGTAGDIAWDASYIYVCTATNTWKRAALSTW